jgi:presenilin-like A22 family membrane protease
MNWKKSIRLNPVFWSVLIFIIAQILTFGVISRENSFLEANQIYLPPQPSEVISVWPETTTSPSGEITQTPAYSSLGPVLIYFFAVVVIMGIVLFVIPISALKYVLRAMFAFLFGWALFIISVLWIFWPVALFISVAVGLTWFFIPKIWLHNAAMVLAMVSIGAVFGRMLSPWTAMIILLALSIYDYLAVRFGYMIWMAKKMSDTNALPAFFIPKSISEWRHSLKESAVTSIVEEKPADRQYSILGGGDIGFPLLLVSSVYFASGFNDALIIAVFSLLGLIGAYWIQAKFLKGNAMPALPPISVASLLGLTIITLAALI